MTSAIAQRRAPTDRSRHPWPSPRQTHRNKHLSPPDNGSKDNASKEGTTSEDAVVVRFRKTEPELSLGDILTAGDGMHWCCTTTPSRRKRHPRTSFSPAALQTTADGRASVAASHRLWSKDTSHHVPPPQGNDEADIHHFPADRRRPRFKPELAATWPPMPTPPRHAPSPPPDEAAGARTSTESRSHAGSGRTTLLIRCCQRRNTPRWPRNRQICRQSPRIGAADHHARGAAAGEHLHWIRSSPPLIRRLTTDPAPPPAEPAPPATKAPRSRRPVPRAEGPAAPVPARALPGDGEEAG